MSADRHATPCVLLRDKMGLLQSTDSGAALIVAVLLQSITALCWIATPMMPPCCQLRRCQTAS